MRRLYFVLAGLLVINYGFAQTNTFPSSGNVGIGTTNPDKKLTIYGNVKLYNPSGYPYGYNVDLHYTGGWAREYSFSYNGMGKLFSFGVYGTGDSLYYGYISGNSTYDLAHRKPWMVFLPSGRVGIGTKNPAGNLEIDGRSNTQLIIRHAKDVTSNDGSLVITNDINSLFLDGNEIQSETDMYINNDNATNLLINNGGGNVGIGTTTPQSKLAVNGTVTAQKVKVTQTGWPDYVFDSAYQLPPLHEIERFVQQYGHLPGVPSSKEIKDGGLDLGEMQKKQMQKIEEMMLYLIRQNKLILKQRADIKKLNERIKRFENKNYR